MKIITTKHAKFSLGYHIIWCSKCRHSILEGAIEVELKQVLPEICSVYGWSLESIEVMLDHVHIFVQADPHTAPSEIAKTLKSISAVHLFNKFPNLKQRRFWGSGLWSRGTYYGTVGHISEEVIRKYIESQKQKN